MEGSIPLGRVDPLLSLLIMVCSIMVVAFFSSSEAALISVNKIRIRRLAAEGHGNAQAVERLVANHDRLFAAILLTENAAIIFSSSVATTFFHAILPAGLPTGTELIATLIMTVLVVIFGVIWSFGTLDLFGFKITILTSLIPPLIIVQRND